MEPHAILARLAESIDPEHPTPVYHQLAALVRWEVAEGRLPIGTVLPPLRAVAEAVGINYHTVRRGWEALAAEGILTMRPGRGARIVRAALDDGRWSPAPRQATPGDAPRVWVADVSLEQAARLAGRLAARWQVEAIPYPSSASPPPPGPIVTLGPAGALPWPAREADTSAIEPVLDPATVTVARRNARELGLERVAVVATAADLDASLVDLMRQLPRLGLRTAAVAPEDLGAVLGEGAALALVFRGAWTLLAWEERQHPRVMAAEQDWAAGPLARLATRLGWGKREG